MLIRNLLNRPNGTEVDLDGKKYHFKPNEKGHEVCEVTDKAHVKRLLSIPEAYEPYDPSDAPVSTAVNTNMAGAQDNAGNQGGQGDDDDDDNDDGGDTEPNADTITDAQIDAMDKPTLLMWSQSYMLELEIKPTTPVHVMKQMVKKAAADRKAAAAAAGQGQEGQQ